MSKKRITFLAILVVMLVTSLILLFNEKDRLIDRNIKKETADGWEYVKLNNDSYNRDFIVIKGYSGKKKVDELIIPGEIDGCEVLYFDGYLGTDLELGRLVIPYEIVEIRGSGMTMCSCKEVIFEEGSRLKTIGADSVLGINDMEEIRLPDSLETIGEEAFAYAFNLKKVYLGANVTTIGDGAFYETKISDVEISPENKRFTYEDGLLVDKEENRLIAYDHEKYAESITIPSSIEFVDARCFDGRDLKWIDVEEGNKVYKSINGCLYSKDGKVLYKVPRAMTQEDFILADGVEEFGRYAMKYGSVETVEVPDTVKKIDIFALDSQEVYLPKEIEDVDLRSFTGNIYYKGTAEDWQKVFVNNGSNSPDAYGLFYLGE